MQVAQLYVARAGMCLHVARARLLGVDVARARLCREPVVQPGGVNVARARAQLCILAHAFHGNVARTGTGLQQRVLRRLNLVVDADVLQVLVMPADAHDVARLLNGRVGRYLLHSLLAAAPAGLHFAEDVHLVACAARQVNVP